jgi:hypothetical protein
MVALYWLLNFLSTYWFISEVLPTLRCHMGALWRTARLPVMVIFACCRCTNMS